MIAFVFLFLISLLGLFFIVKRQFLISPYQTPFLTIICLLSALYIFGIFGLLFWGSYFVFILGLFSFLYKVFLFYKSKTPLFNKEELHVLGIFSIFFFLNYFLFKNHFFIFYDEYAHWGIFTKITLIHDDIVGPYNNLRKADYPRISSLLQYYFNLIINQGKFTQGTTILSQLTIFASALIAFLPKIKKRKIYPSILISLIIAFVFYVLSNTFVGRNRIFTIDCDNLLGLFFGMSILLYLLNKKNKKRFLIVGLVLFCMVQLKEIGILFSLFAVFVIVCLELFEKKKNYISILKRIVLLLIFIIISKTSWTLFKKYRNIEKQSFSMVFSDNSFTKLEDYQKTTLDNYWNVLTKRDSKDRDHIISYIDKIFVFLGIMFFIFRYIKRNKPILMNQNQFLAFIGSLFLCVIAYLFVLLFLYLFASFYEHEKITLTSYKRYIGSMYYGIFLLAFYFVIRFKKILYLLVFSGIILFLNNNKRTITDFFPKKQFMYSSMQIFNKAANVLEDIKLNDTDPKVYIISQGDELSHKAIMQFLIFPTEAIYGPHSVSKQKKINERFTAVLTDKGFAKYMSQTEYLFVFNRRGLFEEYQNVFRQVKPKEIWMLTNNDFKKITLNYKSK